MINRIRDFYRPEPEAHSPSQPIVDTQQGITRKIESAITLHTKGVEKYPCWSSVRLCTGRDDFDDLTILTHYILTQSQVVVPYIKVRYGDGFVQDLTLEEFESCIRDGCSPRKPLQ